MKGADAVALGALGLAGILILKSNTSSSSPQPGTIPGAIPTLLNPLEALWSALTPTAQALSGGVDIWSAPYSIVNGQHWYSPGGAFVGTDWFIGNPDTPGTPFLSVPYTDLIPDWLPFIGGF